MRCFTEFDQLYKSGSHAFLFTGSINDGFPVMKQSKETYPVDLLESWHYSLVRQLQLDENDLFWIYDPAFGFQFVSTDQIRDSTMELRFRKYAFNLKENTNTNPIEEAAQKRVLAAPLPKDPIEAFELMYAIFSRITQERIDQTSLDIRCIAIIPDIDVLCPGTLGGSNSKIEQLALMILRMAENDEFGRQGHLLIMSAKTISGIPERLRRPESPIVPIIITPPNNEERLQFISWLTNQNNSRRVELCALEQTLKTEIETVQKQLEETISSLNRDLATLEEQTRDFLKTDDLIVKSIHERTRLQDVLSKIPIPETRKMEIQSRISELEHRLLNDPELQQQPITETLWKTLRKNDLIIVRGLNDTYEEYIRVMKNVDSDGDVQLAEIAKNPDAFNKIKMTKNGGCPVLFSWSDIEKMTCRAQKGDKYEKINFNEITGIYLLRDSREQCKKNLAVLQRLLEEQDFADPGREHALKEIEDVNSLIEARVQFFLDKETTIKQELDPRLQSLLRMFEKPISPEIKRLEQEIKSLQSVINRTEKYKPFPIPKMGVETLVNLTGNLGYRDLVTIFRESEAKQQELTETEVMSRRIALLTKTYGDLLEIENPPYGFNGIAGMDGLKKYFLRVRDAMLSGNIQRVPMGCLLMGPPGTGKSAIATALAHEASVLLVKIRPIRDKFVGESEQKMERLLQALRSLSPVIVFRDEIDQEDQGRDGHQGDSGVSNRIRQAWMQFLADPTIRGRVYVVSATNRPDLLDAALKRAGRTDDRIPILMPDFETRKSLFFVMIKRSNFNSSITDFTIFAKQTDGLTGADIEVIVRRADQFGSGIIDETSLTTAVSDYIPSASVKDIARMTISAINNCSSRQFLPVNSEEELTRAQCVLNQISSPS